MTWWGGDWAHSGGGRSTRARLGIFAGKVSRRVGEFGTVRGREGDALA